MNNAKYYIGSTSYTKDILQEIKNPYTNEIVSRYPLCNEKETKQALKTAQIASKATKKSTISQRVSWLEDVAKSLNANEKKLAKIITDEIGKPILFSTIEVQRCIETIKLSIQAGLELSGKTINTDAMPSGKKSLSFYIREPVGVVGAITPFNFPLNLIAHKLAPAIMAGNAVVLKPTPEAPLIAYEFIKLFIQSPYAIKDAISLVYGDSEVGSTIVKSDIPRVISFTGSVQVGNMITKTAGIKKVSLELGGNAATFVQKSADLKHAASRCAFGAFYNSGQVCISLQRIYVDESIYDEFASYLKDEVLKLKVGNPYDQDTFIGPLINEDSIKRAKSWVQSAIDEGAKLLIGNKHDGLLYYPTVLTDVTDDMNIVCQEVFAPIVSLVKVKDYQSAIIKMNDSPYGLQFSIFTNDLEITKNFINDAHCGGVVINDIPTLRFDIQPYGGVKLSGIGKEGPSFAIEEFSEIKSVVIN